MGKLAKLLDAVTVATNTLRKTGNELNDIDQGRLWYRGIPDEFSEAKFLDAPEGTYFAGSTRTSDAYLDRFPKIKPEKFKQKFGMSLEDATQKVEQMGESLRVRGIDTKDIVAQMDYPDEIQDEIRRYNNSKQKLNPYFYNSPNFPESEWIDYDVVGDTVEANLPKNMMDYEMHGAAWDEPTQKRIAKEAMEQGYDGVVFKNMQDSGWFGGNGVDDIALVFDPNKVHVPGARLDPSQASRMERARAQGFDRKVFHGSAESNIQEFDPSLSGSVQTSDWGEGVYVSPGRGSARYYAQEAASRVNDDVGDALYDTYEAKAKEYGTRPMHEFVDLGRSEPEKLKEIKALRNKWADHKEQFRKDNAGHVYDLLTNVKNPLYYQYEGVTDPFLADRARAGGYDSIFIHHRPDIDEGETLEQAVEEILILDPKNLRRTDAAFDPSKRDSANLLASAAGVGYLGASGESEAGVGGALSDAAKTFRGEFTDGFYHGSDETFTEFDPSRQRSSSTSGHYFADADDGAGHYTASGYGSNVGEYSLRLGKHADLTDLSDLDTVDAMRRMHDKYEGVYDGIDELSEDVAGELLSQAQMRGDPDNIGGILEKIERARLDESPNNPFFDEWWEDAAEGVLSPDEKNVLLRAANEGKFDEWLQKASSPDGYNDSMGPAFREDVVGILQAEGYDSVSLWDDAPGGGVSRSTVVFDPSRIRSPDAAFDPAKRDSANLLASATGAGILGAGMAPESDAATFNNMYTEGPQKLAEALGKGANFVFDAIEIPTRGLHGLAAALGTAAEGGSFNQALNRGADVSRMSIPQISQHLGTYTADRTGNPYAAALVDALTNVVALEP